MIFLNDKGISAAAVTKLAEYQTAVNSKLTFPEKVDEAKRKFKGSNVIGNKTFDDVKKQLSAMCCGPDRCNYCEDSKADEVEHIKPKNWYPEVCFSWENYCYACGPCNGPKKDQHAVFERGTRTYRELVRKDDDPVTAPPAGDDVMINPRKEDPLDFLFLDLVNDEFMFTEKHAEGTEEYERAKYTIKVLRLNSRSYLAKARRNAYENFLGRVTRYIKRRDEGVAQQQLNNMIQNLKEEHHQTVWQEMKRQHNKIQELTDLFQQAPEALNW